MNNSITQVKVFFNKNILILLLLYILMLSREGMTIFEPIYQREEEIVNYSNNFGHLQTMKNCAVRRHYIHCKISDHNYLPPC
jgi:hypothetical protein